MMLRSEELKFYSNCYHWDATTMRFFNFSHATSKPTCLPFLLHLPENSRLFATAYYHKTVTLVQETK
jgi:hypothetical protein